MSEELREFLEKPGAVEIVCAIPPEGVGFGALLDTVRISRGTLHTRLDEGLHSNEESDFPGLWARHTGERQDGKSLYVLTEHGKRLRRLLRRHGMPSHLREIVTRTEEFDRQKTNVLDTVEEYGLHRLDEVYSTDK